MLRSTSTRAPLRSRLQALALLGLLVGTALSAHRVRQHAESELRHTSEPVALGALGEREGSTSISARLTGASLEAGELATFELCAEDPMLAEAWRGAFLVLVWAPVSETLGLRIPLDERQLSLARRRGGRACMPLGGGAIPVDDRYVVDLVHRYQPIPPDLGEVRVWGKIDARRPLGPWDALGFALLLGSVIVLFATWFEPRVQTEPLEKRDLLRLGLPAVVAGLAVVQLLFVVPSAGPVAVLGRGLMANVALVFAALLGARALSADPRAALGLSAPPRRVAPALILALSAGAGAYGMARALLHLVPSTGEAPITGFVAWSSGALSFATLGLWTPIGEELFFRGLLFRVLEAFGRAFAVVGSASVFALLHLTQTHGNWGAFAAIAAAGLLFSVLRGVTGSVLVPAFAHLAYNAMLSLSAFD